MSIMWKYLDKRSATIAALKDYESMQFIIKNTDNEVAAEREKAAKHRDLIAQLEQSAAALMKL